MDKEIYRDAIETVDFRIDALERMLKRNRMYRFAIPVAIAAFGSPLIVEIYGSISQSGLNALDMMYSGLFAVSSYLAFRRIVMNEEMADDARRHIEDLTLYKEKIRWKMEGAEPIDVPYRILE